MKARLSLGAIAMVMCVSSLAPAQETTTTSADEIGNRRHLLSSSLFMVANLFPDSPSFYQLSYGYRLTLKDVLIVEAITWTYNAPLSIPYWASSDIYSGARHSGLRTPESRNVETSIRSGSRLSPG